ncbi:MAG: N-acetylmuramoyl-L-alanine amidase [Firmicutes bacterium]|nr:N-acetylmuramoyl-L-alanine amidase [Bacillota bacterium]
MTPEPRPRRLRQTPALGSARGRVYAGRPALRWLEGGLPARSGTARLALALALAASICGWAASGPLLGAALTAASLGPPTAPAALILQGFTVALDPGHGGYDPGALATGPDGGQLRECDINLDVCLALRDLLEKAGAVVVMTRTDDTGLLRPEDIPRYGSAARAELSRRAEVATAGRPGVFVSVHCNTFPSPTWRGAQTFYLVGSEESARLAEAIQSELVRVTGETDRLPNTREALFLLGAVSCPAVTVELGFLTNPQDLALLSDPDYRKLCALALFFGLCRYFRLAPAGPGHPG